MPKTSVFVISAPSGTGKTTLNRRLVKENPNIEISISLTTRPKRPSEVDGQDYYFVRREDFEKKVEDGELLEWAEVFGHLYGTSRSDVDRIRSKGSSVILEIDVQGWKKAKDSLEKATSVFILPPSLESVWKRLEGRGTDSLEVRWRRLLTARQEIESGSLYDYFIVNDDLDEAYKALQSIVIKGEKGKIGAVQGTLLCKQLLAEFDQAGWLDDLRQRFAGTF